MLEFEGALIQNVGLLYIAKKSRGICLELRAVANQILEGILLGIAPRQCFKKTQS